MIKHLSPKSEEELMQYYNNSHMHPHLKMETACEDGLLQLAKNALEEVKQTFSAKYDIHGNFVKHLTENNIKELLHFGLLCASYDGQIEIVKYLIEQGAVPDKLVYMWARDNETVSKLTQEKICKLLRCHRKLRKDFILKQ